jgi:hypothetical protein
VIQIQIARLMFVEVVVVFVVVVVVVVEVIVPVVTVVMDQAYFAGLRCIQHVA